MKKRLSIFTLLIMSILLLIMSILLTSCATILSGTRQSVVINSEPPDATVYVQNPKYAAKGVALDKTTAYSIGRTPLTVDVKRNTPMIFVAKDGYRDTLLYSFKRYAKTPYGKVKAGKYNGLINGWYYCNLIYGGIYGILIDLGTGAYIKLPEQMGVTLTKK